MSTPCFVPLFGSSPPRRRRPSACSRSFPNPVLTLLTFLNPFRNPNSDNSDNSDNSNSNNNINNNPNKSSATLPQTSSAPTPPISIDDPTQPPIRSRRRFRREKEEDESPGDDDGLKSRLAARRNRAANADVMATYGVPCVQLQAFLDEAARRSTSSRKRVVESVLPYDIQREIFDILVRQPRKETSDDSNSNNNNNDSGNGDWMKASLRVVVGAARFVNPFAKDAKQKSATAVVDAAAMAHEADDMRTAAAAYAAAAAIATSASMADADSLQDGENPETNALVAAVTAARAIRNLEDVEVFRNTIGVVPLVVAVRLLTGAQRAAALTALANLAIMQPKVRSVMLRVDDSLLLQSLREIVCTSAQFMPSVWRTEQIVSGTHLLGSLALARGKIGKVARAGLAKDKKVIKALERLAGGLKRGEPEGAARAARRALGSLGVNKWTPRMPGQKGLRILCIDGGGTRAIMAFETLKELKKSTGCEIHEMFDIIGGTSTGAIVAASVGITRKSVEEVELLYRDLIGKIFAKHPVNGPKMLLTKSYYDTGVLESTLKQECGKGVFIDSLAEENMNRVFVVSSIMSRNPKELHIFRNYTYALGNESRYDGTAEAQLWEGLRASSAAPTFFSEIRVNGELHADGAIVANNPTAVALHESKCLYPDVPIELLVSVGNGTPPAFESGDEEGDKKIGKMGWGDVVGSIVASATSTEVVHHAMQDLFPKDKYFRFNPTTDSTQIDETSPETLATFVKEARHFIEEHRDEFEKVASILRPRTPGGAWRRFVDALRR